MARFAALSSIDLVIVDDMVEQSVLDKLEELGIEYEIAAVENRSEE